MIISKHILTLVFFLTSFSISFTSLAQQSYKMNGTTEFSVSGTSTLKDWTMESHKGNGTAKISVDNGRINSIEKLSVSMRGESLESGTSGMDKNAYKALKADQHPVIRFSLKEVIANRGNRIKIKGNLTIAGVTKSKTFDMNVNNSSNSLRFSGEFDVTFSEFNMTPPTAVWGTIKTGNELTLSFDTQFKPIK